MSIEIIKDIVKVEEIKEAQDTQTLVITEIYLNTNKQEIESILWVEGRTDILNTKILKDRLLVNGKIKFNVVYKGIDEVDNINTLETVEEFREEIVMIDISEDMESQVKPNIEYIEYEVHDNRIDLQAVVNLSAKVTNIKEVEIIEEIKGKEDLQVLEESIRYKEIYGSDISYANIKEEIKVDDSKPAIEKVIRFNIEAKELQTLVTEDRMILSAEVKVSMIYSGNNQINYISENIPFNHFIEIPGINKSSLGEVKLEIKEGIYEILEDESGEFRIIDLQIDILVAGKVYDYRVRPLVVDVYSTKEKLNIEKEDINIMENVENISYEEELNIDIGIDVIEVLDIREDYNILDKKIVNDEIVVEGLLTVDIFYIERVSGNVRNFKDNFPYKSNIYFDGEYDGKIFDINAKLGDIKYDIKKDILSIDNSIKYDIGLDKEKRINGIKNIEETGELIDLKDRASITVYFIQKGDLLWDIAKRYNSTIDSILESNNLESSYEVHVGDKIIIEKSIDNEFEFI